MTKVMGDLPDSNGWVVEENNQYQKRRTEIRALTVKFYTYTISSSFINGTSYGTTILQSSINIKDHVGTNTLGISNLVTTLCCPILPPVILQRLGGKTALILGELAIFTYIAANFYPALYLMIPGGILKGFGNSLLWTTSSLYNLSFGLLRSHYDQEDSNEYGNKYIGRFFAFFSLAQIAVGLITFAILQAKDDPGLNSLPNNTTDLFPENRTMTQEYSECGANDCQNPNAAIVNLLQYVPSSITATYILIGCFCLLYIAGVVVQMITLIPLGTSQTGTEEKGKKRSICSILRETAKQAIDINQIILSPLVIYFGIMSAFVTSEMTRAYVSCVLGVAKIGQLPLALCGGMAVTSFFTGKLIHMMGRNPLMLIASILDVGNMIFCLTWSPNPEEGFLIFISAAVFGVKEALWRNTSMAVYAEYFPEKREVAFSFWNCGYTIGLTVGYFWSPLLCVRSKLYVQFCLLGISTLCYVTAELRRSISHKK